MERHYSTHEVCEILGIANRTLRRWIKEGRIRAVNIGGRWRIPESEIKRILGQPVEEITTPKVVRAVIYARISRANQRKELENQVEALKKYVEENNWRLEGIVKDIASGLKENRRELWKLVENKLYLYVVFTKGVEITNATGFSKVCGIDINENNVTVYCYPQNKAVTIVTNFSKVVLGYAYIRARI